MKEQAMKVLKGAGIAAMAAFMTYVTDNLQIIPMTIHMGDNYIDIAPMVMMGWSIVVNIIRKLLRL